ncbi:MAG: hypothetical protein K8U57_15890 [Planctomycetes bacterium]|nr:hypothetical protein [Planctomycetota bacterium]
MAKRLPRPMNPIRVRLEWDESNMRVLDMAAADCGLSVASFARLALEMLTKDGEVKMSAVKDAATRLTSNEPEPEPKAAPKKGKK